MSTIKQLYKVEDQRLCGGGTIEKERNHWLVNMG